MVFELSLSNITIYRTILTAINETNIKVTTRQVPGRNYHYQYTLLASTLLRTLDLSEESYFRNTSCAANQIPPFLLLDFDHIILITWLQLWSVMWSVLVIFNFRGCVCGGGSRCSLFLSQFLFLLFVLFFIILFCHGYVFLCRLMILMMSYKVPPFLDKKGKTV